MCIGYVSFHLTNQLVDSGLILPFTVAVNFFNGTKIEANRIMLAVYPLL